MNTFYAYTRVSTVEQSKGVSLDEQRDAISRYAERQGLQISEWVEEQVTAAKSGRPLFMDMLKKLKRGAAAGVIFHKIDRSARNLQDWVDLTNSGLAVHFAHESFDLHSRGGRLAADIQAVVASDYVRNLREECLKGIHGRLKQGLLPFGAPLGYLNTGKGNAKTIDPLTGPLVRQAFEQYATGRYTLDTLRDEMHRRGLRNRRGHSVDRNGLSRILNNSFYAGVIRILATGETYAGVHSPLITMALFKRVQARLAGRVRTHKWIHDFTLRGLFQCALCTRHLVGERQKGHIYYRCHGADCPTRGFREEELERAMLAAWAPIAASDEWCKRLLRKIELVLERDCQDEGTRKAQIELQIDARKSRMKRLIDAFVDGALDKDSFEERKRTLLEEQRSLEDSLQSAGPNPEVVRTKIAELFELASRAQQSYRLGNSDSRRELAIRLCSNRSVAGKDIVVEPHIAFRTLEKRQVVSSSGGHRDRVRTLEEAAATIRKWAVAELEQQIGRDDDRARAA